MTPSYDKVRQLLKTLPGLGHRAAERIALYLLVEHPLKLAPLLEALQGAASLVKRCDRCCSLTETPICAICADYNRDPNSLCVVEHVPDLFAVERSGAFRGRYFVLHGRLSPINGIGPEQLNITKLMDRLYEEPITEIVLALSNDIEGEATCHYISETIHNKKESVKISRIGFGLPSGSGLTFADSATMRSALEGRRYIDD